MVGLDHDVLAGSEPEDHDPDWTRSHVDARAGWSLAEVIAEWDADAPRVEQHVRDTDPRPLNDMVIHEHDLRGALGSPGARDTAGVARVRGVMADRLAGALPDDLAPVRMQSDPDGWEWTSGDGEPGVVLRASSFDLFRALTSRRTADQLRSWVVAGDVAPYLDHLALLGPLPDAPLPE